MTILGRVQALGSGLWLRQVLRQHVRATEELRAINTNLRALTAAITRLVPPPPDTTEPPQASAWIGTARDDDLLRNVYDLQADLKSRWNRDVDIEEAVEEYERRQQEAEKEPTLS